MLSWGVAQELLRYPLCTGGIVPQVHKLEEGGITPSRFALGKHQSIVQKGVHTIEAEKPQLEMAKVLQKKQCLRSWAVNRSM